MSGPASEGPVPGGDRAGPEREGLGRRAAVLGWLTLLLVLGARAGLTYREFSATIDEGRHVAAAVEVYQNQAYTVYYGNPPLPRYFTGLLPYLAGARVPEPDDDEPLAELLPIVHGDREHAVGKYVLESSGADYWEVLSGARAGNLVFLALLLAYVYRWSAQLFGRAAGLLSSALLSFSPLVIGHGALATTDVAGTAGTLVAAYHTWRWALRPGLGRCVAAAAAFGFAFCCKPTVPPFLLLNAFFYFLIARWGEWTDRRSWNGARVRAVLGRGALFGLVAFLVVWAAYLFMFFPVAERSPWIGGAIDRRVEPGTWLNERLHWVAESVPVPIPVLADGLRIAKQETSRPWPSYLCGAITSGSFRYFPAAMALKSTPFFLALTLGSALLWLLRWLARGPRRPAWVGGATFVFVGACVFLGGPVLSRMNIGVRHVMPVYAFLAVLGGLPFAPDFRGRTRRLLRSAAVLLFLGHGVESLAAHPDYLAYFTPLARGNESYYLLDSNLDWGQDVARLARYAEEHGLEDVTVSVFGSRYGTSPRALGMRSARYLEPGERPQGWFAVSYNHLAGIGLSEADYAALEGFSWLEGQAPSARIGKSILLYHLP